MDTRTTIMAGVAAVLVLAAAGVGLAAAPDSLTDNQAGTLTVREAAAVQAPDDAERTVDAGAAGAVHYTFGDALTIASIDTAPGWTAEIEQARGAEIEVVFTNGSRRVDVEVEIEDGAPRERVRERPGRGDARDDDRDRHRGDDRGGRDRRGDDRRDGHRDGDDHGDHDHGVADDHGGHDVADDRGGHGMDEDHGAAAGPGGGGHSGHGGGGDDGGHSGHGGGGDDGGSGHGGSGRDHPEDD